MNKKINIALLVGGFGGEREVSINSGDNVFNALNKEKYNIFKYDFRDDLKKFISDAFDKKFELVIPILHGKNGEDGRLQGFLDILEIPYLFSNALSSAIAMNKYKTKIVIKDLSGIHIAKDYILNIIDKIDIEKIINKLELPIVLKPMDGGSSCGVSIVNKKEELENAIKTAFTYGDDIIIEEYIKGRELTVPVVEINKEIKALPVIEIIPKISKWFDYKAKYEDNGSLEICPAEIDEKIAKEAQNISEKIFKEMDCSGLARVDFILNEKNELYFLEINTIPGLTKNSLTPKALKVMDISMEEFFDKLIEDKLNVLYKKNC